MCPTLEGRQGVDWTIRAWDDLGARADQRLQGVVQHLSAGETTVGFEVNVRHLAPADIGDTIVATAELTEVDRNRLTFRVDAFHGERKIGEGTHRRAIIQMPS